MNNQHLHLLAQLKEIFGKHDFLRYILKIGAAAGMLCILYHLGKTVGSFIANL